jgi:hypothetical protein
MERYFYEWPVVAWAHGLPEHYLRYLESVEHAR